MADPERIFYQALCKFEHLRIYANVVNDRSVPYPSAAIEADDIFNEHLTNGIEMCGTLLTPMYELADPCNCPQRTGWAICPNNQVLSPSRHPAPSTG